MRFRKWFEMTIGDTFENPKIPWMARFSAIKRDNVEGWIINLNDPKIKQATNISKATDLSVGDEISDYSLNFTPYWKVTFVDPQKNLLYVEPMDKNPWKSGVGAGGKKLDQHDYEVATGEYEQRRVDDIIQGWQQGHAHSPRDVAYLLLGTVPVNMGPNGSQGGWYNASDVNSNRGGQRGMDAKEIMMKDAATLKNTFKFQVPAKALDGTMDVYDWKDWVNGGIDHRKVKEKGYEIEGEDFNDPKAMANMILKNPSPSIKLTNTEALLDYFHRIEDYRKVYWGTEDRDESDRIRDKWIGGEWDRKEMEPFMKDLIRKVAQMNWESKHDQYWHTKEKFLYFIRRKKWWDLLELFQHASDNEVREKTFDGYEEAKNYEMMWEMLNDEKHPENLSNMIYALNKIDRKQTIAWVEENLSDLQHIVKTDKIGDGYYARELGKTIKTVLDQKNWMKYDQ